MKIFISCPREFAGQLPALRAALKARRIDARAAQDIGSADLWFESIGRELTSAAVFVFVVGEGGLGDWQQKELSRALEHTWADTSKTLLVVTLGTSAKVPPAFAQSDCIVADGPQPDLKHLADQIAEATRKPRAGAAETPPPDRWCALVPTTVDYVKFISDLKGYDPKAYDGSETGIINAVLIWYVSMGFTDGKFPTPG